MGPAQVQAGLLKPKPSGFSPFDRIRIDRLTCGRQMQPFHWRYAAPNLAGRFRPKIPPSGGAILPACDLHTAQVRALTNTGLDAAPTNIAALVRGKEPWHKA